MPRDEAILHDPQPPSGLVSDVFDGLMQANRKELAHLLNILLRASEPGVLQRVQAAAVACGAWVVVRSRFQQCSHQVLDGCFSFLDLRSLGAAEAVCKRWRLACVDSKAGWPQALAHVPRVTNQWAAELHRHRIDPTRLWAMRRVFIAQRVTAATIRAVLRLPAVVDLEIKNVRVPISLLSARFLPGLRRLMIATDDLHAQLAAVHLPSLTALHVLESTTAEQVAHLVARFPTLEVLSVDYVGSDGTAEPLAGAIGLGKRLRCLGLQMFDHDTDLAPLQPLLQRVPALRLSGTLELCVDVVASLTHLETLELRPYDPTGADQQLLLAPLAALVNLTCLTVCVDVEHTEVEGLSVLLSRLTKLTRLDLSLCPCTDQDVAVLFATATRLRTLTWHDAANKAVVAGLPRLRHLTDLGLRVGDAAAVRLATKLPRLTVLRANLPQALERELRRRRPDLDAQPYRA